jgi:hypothetical protein
LITVILRNKCPTGSGAKPLQPLDESAAAEPIALKGRWRRTMRGARAAWMN